MNDLIGEGSRSCPRCGQDKSPDEFPANRTKRAGRDFSRCLACTSEYNHRYYLSHRETILGRHRDTSRAWYAANRAEVREKQQRYRDANRGAMREQQTRHRAEVKAQVFGHYGTSCACCGITERLSIDHVNGDGAEHRSQIFSRRDSGQIMFYLWLIAQGFPAGYQTLCLPCNSSKGKGQRCRLSHGATS